MCVVVPRSSWDEALATLLVPVSVRCGTLPLSVGGLGGKGLCRLCLLMERWWRQFGVMVLYGSAVPPC